MVSKGSMAVITCCVVFTGYLSNIALIGVISAESYTKREEYKRVHLEALGEKRTEEMSPGAKHVLDECWVGPTVDCIYNGWIPFVVTVRYRFVSPMHYGQLAGYRFSEVNVGIFWPFWTLRYDASVS